MITLINENNYQDIKNAEKSLVYITTKWCGPCKTLGPIIENYSKNNPGSINIGKIDAEELSDITATLNVRSVPTLIFFKNGEEVDRHIGLIQNEALVEKINNI
jgi:thioredoxin 1